MARTEKGEKFIASLREGVQGNDSIRPSFNPHQNMRDSELSNNQFQMGQRSRNDLNLRHPDERRPKPNSYQKNSDNEGR